MSEYVAIVMRIIIIFVLLFTLTFCIGSAYAKTIHIDVEGLVCDFCAQSIEKVFMKQPGVEKVNVNLNDGRVIIKMADVFQDDEDGISNDRIEKLFLEAGYEVTAIMR
tara:strand:+ start:276 stop:599 length:324 start_codon:yes stop_codon:yes gene_type:complete